jgi:hypothetical protein
VRVVVVVGAGAASAFVDSTVIGGWRAREAVEEGERRRKRRRCRKGRRRWWWGDVISSGCWEKRQRGSRGRSRVSERGYPFAGVAAVALLQCSVEKKLCSYSNRFTILRC